MRLVALAGGTGAAKLLRGLDALVGPGALEIIGNTGDDALIWGLHVSPDLDTVCYTLGGLIDEGRGWGLRDETFRTLGEMVRFREPTWFNLGDRDLATHLHRSRLLREGLTLTEVTTTIARDLGVRHAVLPMSDQPVSTRILASNRWGPDGWLSFQEYFVREKTQVEVKQVDYAGATSALPAPGVLEAIAAADAVIVCPSNPVTSIGPILAVPGIARALEATEATVLAVSPIIGGQAVSGPAGRLMAATGLEVSALGVAAAYAPWLDALLLDGIDAWLAPRLEASGVQGIVTDTLMRDREGEIALARRVLEAVA
jgi:LPPG:FO 2-phospho-L-lactate transferase